MSRVYNIIIINNQLYKFTAIIYAKFNEDTYSKSNEDQLKVR